VADIAGDKTSDLGTKPVDGPLSPTAVLTRRLDMARYFFDIQSGRDCFSDEEGLELPNHKAAEIEAMQSLIGMARNSVYLHERPDMVIEVRSATERLFCASLIYRTASLKQ
jgi:Domain of unknown function (DUF6894)